MAVNTVAPGFCKSELMIWEPGAPFLQQVVEFLTATCPPTRVRREAKPLWMELCVAVKCTEVSKKNDIDQFSFTYQTLTGCHSPGTLVPSKEGLQLRQKVWEGVLDILRPVAPEIGVD